MADHLGSTSVTVDATGNLLTALKYTAYGELRNGTSITDYQYTGQRNEIEIGLYFYVARMYDPQLARFISADTIIPEPVAVFASPSAARGRSIKGYDRYMYVNGNPISFNDPSGHRFCDTADGTCDGGGGGNEGGSSTTSSQTEVAEYWYISNNLLSKGTIYTTTWVIPNVRLAEASLSTKAEESYSGSGPLTSPAPILEGVQTAMGIYEDMQPDIDYDPIGIELDWQLREQGLLLDRLTIKNYSKLFIGVNNIEIYNSLEHTYSIQGPKTRIGVNGKKPGTLSMDIGLYIAEKANSTILIKFIVIGGYPSNLSKELNWQAGYIPGQGCSYVK